MFTRLLGSTAACLEHGELESRVPVVFVQLQQSGSVALVHILHQGFPHRLPLRATAASFKARLAVCLNTVLEQTAGAGGDPEVRRKLKTLQNLHNLPDGRLSTSIVPLRFTN